MDLDDKPLSDSDFKDLREICQGSREGPAFYKDDFHFGSAGAAAARILSRHGVTASMNGDTGQVTFRKAGS